MNSYIQINNKSLRLPLPVLNASFLYSKKQFGKQLICNYVSHFSKRAHTNACKYKITFLHSTHELAHQCMSNVLLAMVDHIPNLSFGSDSEGEVDLSSQEPVGGESPLSEEMMRILWMTGTNALNFLIFVGIAMFPAV